MQQKYGGGGRIRTCEAEAADLQSAGFDRSPTPPIGRSILLLPMKDVNQKNLNRENILSYLNIDKKDKIKKGERVRRKGEERGREGWEEMK